MLNDSERTNKKESHQELRQQPGMKVGVLLLHGLTGTPGEMRPLAKALEKLGFDVEVPTLPGHGVGEDLLATTWQDWMAGPRDELKRLSARCDHVFVAGLCMGALLSVLLAEDTCVSGIVAMSPTIRYDGKNTSNPFQVFLPLVDIFPFLGRLCYWTEGAPYGLKDQRLQKIITRQLEAVKRGKKTGFGQFRTYACSLRQLQHLVAETKQRAAKVKCPALIMHSTEDTLTSMENPKILHAWLGSADKSIVFLEGTDHMLTMDLKKEEVASHFAAFICRITAVATELKRVS